MANESRGRAGELRLLPSVDLLRARLEDGTTPSDLLLAWIREALDEARVEIRAGAAPVGSSREEWTAEVVRRVAARRTARSGRVLRRVINATGVLLHTNLGRAPLSAEAQRAVLEATSGYSNLELDLGSGKRLLRAGERLHPKYQISLPKDLGEQLA